MEESHRFVQVNGIRMHVAERERGRLVLLCHGFRKGGIRGDNPKLSAPASPRRPVQAVLV